MDSFFPPPLPKILNANYPLDLRLAMAAGKDDLPAIITDLLREAAVEVRRLYIVVAKLETA